MDLIESSRYPHIRVNRLLPTLTCLVKHGGWSEESGVKRRAWFNHLNELTQEGLIQRQTTPGLSTSFLFNEREVARILRCVGVSVGRLPAIPGTEQVRDDKDGKARYRAFCWVWEGRPMESCCLESKEELAALRVAELYQGMARLRTDKPVTYFHDNNPRKSRYWKSFMAIAILCEEKGYDPQIYLQAQFEMLNADWCRKVWRSKNPPPNVCHSEKALERYEKYLKRCDARMGAPMKKATTVADWFKCLTIHALRSATDHLIRELRFNDGALTNWRDADLAQVRTRAVVAALDTTWGGVLLAQAKDPFTQTYVADTFAHVDTKAYTNVLKMVADPKNREILSQIYQEVKIHSLEEYDSYQEGAEARMAFEAIESYLAGEPLTLPVAPPRSAEAKKRVRIRQRMLKVGAFVSGEGQLHYGRVI